MATSELWYDLSPSPNPPSFPTERTQTAIVCSPPTPSAPVQSVPHESSPTNDPVETVVLSQLGVLAINPDIQTISSGEYQRLYQASCNIALRKSYAQGAHYSLNPL